jgi:hypothetical protein
MPALQRLQHALKYVDGGWWLEFHDEKHSSLAEWKGVSSRLNHGSASIADRSVMPGANPAGLHGTTIETLNQALKRAKTR